MRLRGFSRVQLYGALVASAVICAALLAQARLRIDPFSASNLPYYVAFVLAVGVKIGSVQHGWPHARAVGDCAEYYATFAAIALIGAIASYPIAAMTHGYADPTLQRIDLALHFHWLAWYGAVARHRTLQVLGAFAYESIFITPAVLLGWYALHGERGEAHRFLAAFWLAAVLTLLLFSWMPAVGPLSFLWRGSIPYMPISELWQPDLIPALRAHQLHLIDVGQLRGIVSAPSFHAASATLYIAAAWRIRTLRWPLIGTNLAMLVATPVEGTHYLSDMILGLFVAVIALWAVQAGLDWAARAGDRPARTVAA